MIPEPEQCIQVFKVAGKYYYFNKKTGFSVGGFVKFGNNFTDISIPKLIRWRQAG